MTRLIKLRIALFAAAVAGLTLVTGWVAQTSWKRVETLQEKLTREQFESYKTADLFRFSLQTVNNDLYLYLIHQDTNDLARFLSGRKKLDEWIDAQTNLTRPAESNLLSQINVAFDDYFAAATNLEARVAAVNSPRSALGALGQVTGQTTNLLHLADKLLAAHHQAMGRLLEDSRRSLTSLRATMFGASLGLLVLGALLAGMVYRDMIAPLQRKLVESRAIIERQEKLASLGVLAAGVAHEIRNPLTSIKARLYTQQKALRPGSPEHEDAVTMGNEISRLERIVRDVLQFARPDEPQLAVVAAAVPLGEIRNQMAPQLDKHRIKLALEPVAPMRIRIDPAQMKQVLINLIQNAAESMDAGGVVTLRARRATERLGGVPTPAVVLEVQDTGKGIAPDIRERLFDPFFTTKETGTGLGLSIAARIVEKHGGILGFQTQVNHGTTFGIVLPEVP